MSELNKKNDKLISMMAAIDALCHRCDLVSDGTPCTEKCNDIKILEMLTSAQPDLDEWCKDCKEYDSEKHCCHRFGKVIRKTVEELKADNPEIIRCGKCKHHEGETYCHERDDLWYENDFCSYAERRGEEDDEDE